MSQALRFDEWSLVTPGLVLRVRSEWTSPVRISSAAAEAAAQGGVR
jgi:hypothetical protein